MHAPADNLNNTIFKMQLDCICCKSYYCDADTFLLSTKELFVEFRAQSIAVAIASCQKYWNNINGTIKNDQIPPRTLNLSFTTCCLLSSKKARCDKKENKRHLKKRLSTFNSVQLLESCHGLQSTSRIHIFTGCNINVSRNKWQAVDG